MLTYSMLYSTSRSRSTVKASPSWVPIYFYKFFWWGFINFVYSICLLLPFYGIALSLNLAGQLNPHIYWLGHLECQCRFISRLCFLSVRRIARCPPCRSVPHFPICTQWNVSGRASWHELFTAVPRQHWWRINTDQLATAHSHVCHTKKKKSPVEKGSDHVNAQLSWQQRHLYFSIETRIYHIIVVMLVDVSIQFFTLYNILVLFIDLTLS